MGTHAIPRTPRPWRRYLATGGAAAVCAVLVPVLAPATADVTGPARRHAASAATPTALAALAKARTPLGRAKKPARPAPKPKPKPSTPASRPGLGQGAAASGTATPTTPAPAPSAPPPVAQGRPGPGNTGVPGGTQLRRYDGNLVITQPGAVYDGLDIHGYVVVKAPDVTIRRSIVRGGPPPSGPRGLIEDTTPAATGLVVEDTELVPEFPSMWVDSVKGANFTLRRVNAHGTVDLVKVFGDHVRIENSWLHDAQWYANSPGQPDGTHNDGVQVLKGSDIAITGNTISGASNAALMVTQDVGPVTDLRFEGNWVDGGACSVNANAKPLPSMSGLVVNGNRFGRNTRIPDCSIIFPQATTTVATAGNVWDDTGTPVRLRRG